MLTPYDILMLVVLVIAAIRGAIKGIVWQLAVIGSILLCFAFSETGSIYIAPALPLEAPLNRWVAMLILYVVLSFAAFGVARILNNWIEKLKFKEYDRHLGFLFGGVKGVILCLVGTFFVVTISDGYRKTVMNSYSGRTAAVIMDRLHAVMPKELHDVLEPYIHQLDQPGLDLKYSHDHDHDHGHGDGDHGDHDGPNLGTPAVDAGIIDQLLDRIGGESSDRLAGLTDLLKKAFQNTAPQHRDELLNSIKSAAPDQLRELADAWRNGKPAAGSGMSHFDRETPPFDDAPEFDDAAEFDDAPPFDDRTASAEAEWLLGEIVSNFRAGPEAAAAITDVIVDQLSGIPDPVAAAVLRDWHADLTRIQPDPDPGTDAAAPLDVRIVRQLKAAGVPLSTLSSDVENRLRESLR